MKKPQISFLSFIIIFGILLFAFIFFSNRWDKIVDKEITTKVESLGGEIIKVKRVHVSQTPFKTDNVGGKYYEVTYKMNGEENTAYYRRHKSLNINDIPSRGAPAEWIIPEK
ncbi:hypothetical protein [Paenibacillus ihuae]|uniref:hypothetical protein n=1 Tax=Paenibacillus ihuae TaxID=1232431 RepID=UPI0006D53992|nr:hypothetical protein [Paenibacillus ihuae]